MQSIDNRRRIPISRPRMQRDPPSLIVYKSSGNSVHSKLLEQLFLSIHEKCEWYRSALEETPNSFSVFIGHGDPFSCRVSCSAAIGGISSLHGRHHVAHIF